MTKFSNAIVVGLGALLFAAAAQAAYPERPITLIVPWAAGGGTDATARIIGTLLEKELGQPVNVVNRVGGSGVVGHSAIAQGAPDGYTIGIITVEIGMMHWQGLTESDRRFVHAARPRQRGPSRRAGRGRFTLQERQRAGRGHQGESRQVQGVGNRARGHLASRDRGDAAGPEGRSGERAVGAVRRRRAGTARPRGRRRADRPGVAAGSARDDRRRQGQEPRRDGRQAGGPLPQRSDIEGGDGKQLDDGRLARNRRAEKPSARSARQARRGARRRSWRARITPSSWRSRATA